MDDLKKYHNALSEAQGKKVIVGMTGGVDSTVAAFLLKKQGYQCIGVAIQFLDAERIKLRLKPKEGDEEEILKGLQGAVPYEERIRFLEGHCTVNDLGRVKKICEFLDIPFYVIKAISEYQYYVVDQLIGASLSGDYYPSCLWGNNLKMDLMLDRAKTLKADYIATGHYAKIYRDNTSNSFELFAASDTKYDQSYLLARLKQEHMEKLLLPLAELRRQDVLQIIERFKLPGKVWRDSQKMCFYDRGDISYFVEAYSTKDLRIEGKILEKGSNAHIGDHSGIHMFRVGERLKNIRGVKGFHVGFNEEYKVNRIFPGGSILAGADSDCFFGDCFIQDLHLTETVEVAKTIPVFVQYSIQSPKVEGAILFKNNETARIKFYQKVPDLTRGQHLVFYGSNRPGGKVIGCGEVSYLGRVDRIDRIDKLRPKLVDDEDNQEEIDRLKQQQFDPNKFIF